MTLHNDPLEDSLNLPRLYQIYIHWEPVYAPFPLTVRADMTIDDLLLNSLTVLLQISKIYLFLFLDFCKLNLRRRLDELPVVGPGAILILKRWSLQQALQWSEAYRLPTINAGSEDFLLELQHAYIPAYSSRFPTPAIVRSRR
jgi:hypothetical protein